MKLSSREVFQLADRCLASAGLSKGASQASAKSIWWTEVYRRCGLTSLHRIIEESPTLDPAALSLEDRTSVFSSIDSGNQPSIVSSTAALDLSCSQAEQHGLGITYASIPEFDSSLSTIGHAAYNAANRGMVSVVLAEYPDRSGSFIGVPSGSHPLIAETELERPSSGYMRLLDVVDNGLYRKRHSPLMQAFFDLGEDNGRSTADVTTLAQLLDAATEPNLGGSDSDEYGFFIICVDPNHPQNSADISQASNKLTDDRTSTLTTVYQPSEIRERGRELVEEGITVEKQLWEELFEFSNGIFSPDSVGSETGAGPGLEQ